MSAVNFSYNQSSFFKACLFLLTVLALFFVKVPTSVYAADTCGAPDFSCPSGWYCPGSFGLDRYTCVCSNPCGFGGNYCNGTTYTDSCGNTCSGSKNCCDNSCGNVGNYCSYTGYTNGCGNWCQGTQVCPECTLSVNGQVANGTTPVTITRSSQPITISATTKNANTSVAVFISPTNVQSWLPSPNRASGIGSTSLTWTPSTTNNYYIVCNNIVNAGVDQCTGNPWCEGGLCSPWKDCGTQDKQVAYIPPECTGMSVMKNGVNQGNSATFIDTDEVTLRVRIDNSRQLLTDNKFWMRWSGIDKYWKAGLMYDLTNANGPVFVATSSAKNLFTFGTSVAYDTAIGMNGFDWNSDASGFAYQCSGATGLSLSLCKETVLCTPACGQALTCGGNCTSTDATAPGTVTLVNPGTASAPINIPNSQTNVTLSWNLTETNHAYTDKYIVTVQNSAGTTTYSTITTANNTTSSVNILMSSTFLTVGTTYKWNVQAVNSTCSTYPAGQTSGAVNSGYFKIVAGNVACNVACVQNNQCVTGYCYNGVCRNQSCPTGTGCVCTATVTGTLFDAGYGDCNGVSTLPKLSGVTVQLSSGTSTYSDSSDTAGVYSIPNVPVPGTYTTAISNPTVLTQLGFFPTPRYWCRTQTSSVPLYATDAGLSAVSDLGFMKSIPSWFQVMGGNIIAEQAVSTTPTIQSLVPDCTTNTSMTCVPRAMLVNNDYSTLDTDAGFPVVGQSGTSVGSVSTYALSGQETSRIRQAATDQDYGKRGRNSAYVPTRNYEYFWSQYSMGSSPTTLANTAISAADAADLTKEKLVAMGNPARGAYYSATSVTIQQVWQVSATDSAKVIFVNGDLRVKGPSTILVSPGGFLAFIVKGNIIFDKSLSALDVKVNAPIVEGVYIANGSIITESNGTTSDGKFIGAGVFVGWSGFQLNRDYSDPNNLVKSEQNFFYPTELFRDRPDLALNVPTQMARPLIDWREIAP